MCKLIETEKENVCLWRFDKVQDPKDIANFIFYYCVSTDDAFINASQIVGSTHPDYNNGSWSEMKANLKRHIKTLDEPSLKKLILQRYPSKSVQEFNGQYFITEGNHRFCLAKFYGIEEKIPCTVSKYEFNQADFELYEKLKKYFTVEYSNGVFSDVKYAEVPISVSSEDIPKLISAHEAVKISIWDKLLFYFKPRIDWLHFSDTEKSYTELKHIMIYVRLKQGNHWFFRVTNIYKD